MTTDLVVRGTDVDLERATALADAMVRSNFFPDASTAAKAVVKIIAGAELGMGPAESMRSFHIVENKIEFAAETLAIRVKQSARYDYRIIELENDRCVIAFFQDGEEIGRSKFDEDDRDLAEFALETEKHKATPWAKFPRNMMFARAMTNGVAFFCPDVVAGVLPGAVIDVVQPVNGHAPAETPPGEDAVTPASSPGAADTPPRSKKATKAQLSKLIMLAAEHGWDDDERHRRAEVASFNDLTKAGASVLIEAWSADDSGVTATEGESVTGISEDPSVPERDPDGPPSEEILVIARRHIGTDSAIVVSARKWFPEVTNFDSITHLQMGRTVEHWLKHEKPEPTGALS